MFETAMLPEDGMRGALGMTGSLVLQSCLVGGVVVASLLGPVMLPTPPILAISVPAPRLPKAVRVVHTEVAPRTSASPSALQYVRRAFVPRVATSVAPVGAFVMADDLPQVGPASPIGTGNLPVPFDVGRVAPPPPPPPKPKPAEPAVAAKPTVIGGQVLAAMQLTRVQPVYPELARRTRIEGVVQLHGVIGRDGRVLQLRVISGHPWLAKAALDAVAQWTYRPTLLNGQPVKVEAPIEVRFTLSR